MVHMGSWSNKSGLDEMMDFYDDMLWQSFYAAPLSPSYLNRQPYGFLVQDATASIWCSRRMPTPIIWMPHWISVLSYSTSPPSPPSGRGRYAGNFHLLRPTACRKDFAPLRCTTCNGSWGSKATVKCATVDPRLSVCSIRKEEPISQSLIKENRRYFLYGYPNGNRCHPLCRGG